MKTIKKVFLGIIKLLLIIVLVAVVIFLLFLLKRLYG